jgi:hypothetical protein
MIVVGALLAVAAVGATGGVAAAAIHPGDATVHTVERNLPPDAFVQGRADCPQGKRAISGGAAFHRPGEEPDLITSAKLVSSGPTTNGRGWHAAGDSSDEDPLKLRITVVCLPAAAVGPYTVRTKDLVVDGSSKYKGSLSCGPGLGIVTGGAWWTRGAGAAATEADNLERSTPSPDEKRWLARGFTYLPEDAALRIVLLCRPTAAIGPVTIRHRDVGGSDFVRSGAVGCGPGMRAIAGGVDTYEGGVPSVTGSLTSSTVRPDKRGWFAVASALGDATVMRVTALCVPA